MDEIEEAIIKLAIRCNDSAIREYLSGEGNKTDIYNKGIADLEKVLEMTNQAIDKLKSLRDHTCEFEDDFCIHCGLDGLA